MGILAQQQSDFVWGGSMAYKRDRSFRFGNAYEYETFWFELGFLGKGHKKMAEWFGWGFA